MSHDDSLDDETKTILDSLSSDDSKESIIPKIKKNKAGYEIDDDNYETNTKESDDSDW